MRGDAIFSRYYQCSLGPEYRRVEYLRNNGSQAGAYLNLGIGPASATDVEVQAWCTSGHIFGYRQGVNAENVSVQHSAGDICNGSNYSTYRCKIGPEEYGLYAHVIRVSKALREWKRLDGTVVASNTNVNTDTFTGAGPYWLFAINGYQGASGDCKCWYLILRDDNGVPVRNLVPAVRVSDSKPGMYDLCGSICPLTNTPFYINSGTGADFTWGEL